MRITPLDYTDAELATLDLPGGRLVVTRGLGSGLTHSANDPAKFWAIGDRGPNLKVALAVERYGLDVLKPLLDRDGAKLLPFPEIGPAICELRIGDDRVELVRTIAICGRSGRAISGLPPPFTLSEEAEPAFGIDGAALAPDPSGADTEGIAVAPDGDFWVGDEYGPSLLHIAPDGTVRRRLVPAGTESWFAGADYAVEPTLPAIAATRRLNRGFEGLAMSADGARLLLAFQSPLAHPDRKAHKGAVHVRLWAVSTLTGEVEAQYLYPLDEPASFRRDCADGDFRRWDIKLSELASVGPDRLLVLERGTLTTKFYLVRLDDDHRLEADHLDIATRPTVEQISAAGMFDPKLILSKHLILSTDDHPQIDGDLEGVAMISPRSLILVNDNDFGVEQAPTRFWRCEWDESDEAPDA